STCYCEETEEYTADQEAGMTVDCLSIPKKKLAQSQKKINQFINSKMSAKANEELIRCLSLSQIVFGEEHWKCAQALANLAYGYLTLRGLPAQAKKHAEKARNTLLTWKRNTTSDKDKKEILETLVRLYYTLGVAWLLQNQYPFFPNERLSLGTELVMISRLSLSINLVMVFRLLGTELVVMVSRLSLGIECVMFFFFSPQAYSICVSSFSEVSPQTAEASALLAKAYAMSGASEHRDAVEIYFIRSISTYQTLGSEDYETLTAIEDFCTWLIQNGEKQEAYRLLKSTLNSGNFGDCGKKVAETFYNMGSICFAKGELGEAIELLSKCLMIQSLVYGSEHIKSIETKSLLSLLQRWRLKETLEKNRKEASGRETFQKTVITLLQ
uniref:Tetratricopeptide repeat domain 23 like n=1 Tax=Mus spicilegus TaxID=10103 RepID=A0A8C6GAP2_MUSSI